jgi:hypothetical protein
MASTTTPAISELLARVDVGWRPFREAVRGVGRARMNEPTGGGWTYRDLIAHVAAWHDLTARRLRALRDTGTFPGPGDEASLGRPAFRDADDFNARVVASHRLVGAEALVDELDTTFRALRAALSGLNDEQLRAKDDEVIAVVAGNTFGHYAEHARELGLA